MFVIFYEQLQTSKEYDHLIAQARDKISQLGLDVNQIGKDFEDFQRNGVKEEVKEDFIDQAIQEGKRLQENAG